MAIIASALIKLAFPFMDCRVATAHAMTNQSVSAWYDNLKPRILTGITKKAYFSVKRGHAEKAG